MKGERAPSGAWLDGHAAPRILALADDVRRHTWGLTARTRLGRRALRERGLRLTLIAASQLVGAFALVALAPLWLLLLSPLVLGVPHLLSDARSLLTHPHAPLHARRVGYVLVPLAAMLLTRLVAALGGPFSLPLEVALGGTALCAAAAVAPARPAFRWALLIAVSALTVLATFHATTTLLVFAHAHNGVALVLWWVLGRDARLARARALVFGAFALGAGVILAGGLDAAFSPHAQALGLSFEPLLAALAPGIEGPLAVRLVLLFAFAQAVHYTVWLRVIPQSPRYRTPETPPSLARTSSALRLEWGRVGLACALAACCALPLLATLSPTKARDTYLSLAAFHGWLELAALVFLAAAARSPRPR